jgi:hypothetical protein
VRSLGLSTNEQTGTDSQSRTILGNEEEETGSGAFGSEVRKEESNMTASSRPAEYFARVERSRSHPSNSGENVDADKETSDGPPMRQSWGRGVPKSPQGVRKNVWEVRRK